MKQVTELDVPQPLDMCPVETPGPFPKAKTKNSKAKQEEKKKQQKNPSASLPLNWKLLQA